MFTYRFVVVLIFEAAAAHKTCLHADVWNRANDRIPLRMS